MEYEFFIDPETGLPHIYKHNVELDEVEGVLSRRRQYRSGVDGARIVDARTAAGRLLRVIYRQEDERKVFVITAYELRGRRAAGFRRRHRRRR